MSFITAAMIGAGGALLGGYVASQGAKSAAQTQADAASQSGALQKQIFDQQMALQEPYRQAGLTGQNRLMDLLGLSGNTGAEGYGKYSKDFGMSDFVTDPGYNFRLSEGLKLLGHQAAARGGTVSGNTMTGIQDYAQGAASQEYNNAYTRYQTNRTNQLQPLGNLMATGTSAAANQGSAAGNYGTNAGNAYMAAGQANAAGQLGAANTINNALGTAASAYQNQTNFNNWLNTRPTAQIPMQPGGGY